MDNRSLGIFLDDDSAIQGRAVTQLVVCEIGNGVLSGHRGVDDPRDGAPKSFLTGPPGWMFVRLNGPAPSGVLKRALKCEFVPFRISNYDAVFPSGKVDGTDLIVPDYLFVP